MLKIYASCNVTLKMCSLGWDRVYPTSVISAAFPQYVGRSRPQHQTSSSALQALNPIKPISPWFHVRFHPLTTLLYLHLLFCSQTFKGNLFNFNILHAFHFFIFSFLLYLWLSAFLSLKLFFIIYYLSNSLYI